jgi:isopentenyl diphosphate isomerase/L-lactate dehydrogenase-like FMN-dependent dehydrogenase
MLEILNLDSLEDRARERLDPMLFDYIAGGAGDEWTLRENRVAFSRLQLLPRMLRGVGTRDQRTTVLGTPVSFPVLVPPMGFHGLCHVDAEVATARGAASAGTIFVARAGFSCTSIATRQSPGIWCSVLPLPDTRRSA